MSKILLAVSACALLSANALADSKDKKPAAVFMNNADLKWGEVPPGLPQGGQLAVLFGNPGKPGPFAVRLKMPDGYKVPPHWHSQAEQLTVLSGTFVLSMGDTMDAGGAHELTAGGYHYLPAKAHHAATAKGDTVLQINGMGPFDIHYLNPADDPRKGAASRK